MYLTFDTEEKALKAARQIDENYNFPIYGRNAKTGEINFETGVATTWCEIEKAFERDLWYFIKPPVEFMRGVEDFEEAEFNRDWLRPDELSEFNTAWPSSANKVE